MGPAALNVLIQKKTNWVVNGAKTSKIIFYNEPKDNLGWSSIETIKETLSNQNFFSVYFPNISAEYMNTKPSVSDGSVLLLARNFANY